MGKRKSYDIDECYTRMMRCTTSLTILVNSRDKTEKKLNQTEKDIKVAKRIHNKIIDGGILTANEDKRLEEIYKSV